MATLLRRKLKKIMEKDETPISMTISRPEGSISLTKREVQRYTMLLSMLDTDNDNEVGGAEGASFLRRSGLDTDHLREIWRLASGGTSKLRLNKEDFFIACKLVAVTQVKGEPDVRSLTTGESLPLADFHYDLVPEIIGGGTADSVPSGAIKVVVTEPTTYGTGLDKHTKYKVLTTTTLTQFSRKEMSVWRRFSDFEWLHKRLSICFPAAIIPLFPAKRIVGNSESSFIKDRMTSLEAYIDAVAHHPTLNNSLDLLVFLDATDEGLEAAKRYIEEKEAEESESVITKGVDMVMNLAATGQAIPPLVLKADEEFVQACASHGAALARLASVVKTGAVLDAAQKAGSENMINLGRALLALASHERSNINAGSSTAQAVNAAANNAKRTEGALFSGSSSNSNNSSDDAAAKAFNAHTQAAQANKDGSIAGMFSGDFSDPYSSLRNSTLSGSNMTNDANNGDRSNATEDLLIALTTVGDALMAVGTRGTEQLSKLDEIIYAPFRLERDREAELGEAIKRRDAAIDKVQDANAALQRRKKALAGLKPTDPQYQMKMVQAQDAVNKAEKELQDRRDQLEKMTEVLKGEMNRVNKVRRATISGRLVDFARTQATMARARADQWQSIIPSVNPNPAALDISREAVTAIARKAEAKARAASQAAKQRTTGQAGTSVVNTNTGGDGLSASGSTPMSTGGGGMFDNDAPIPSAADL